MIPYIVMIVSFIMDGILTNYYCRDNSPLRTPGTETKHLANDYTIVLGIKFDKNGRVIEVRPHERNDATDLIEDFMLAANETVATHFYWLGIPFVYRVHGKPDREKIDDLQEFDPDTFVDALFDFRKEGAPEDLSKIEALHFDD